VCFHRQLGILFILLQAPYIPRPPNGAIIGVSEFQKVQKKMGGAIIFQVLKYQMH
jgi:hypothetical protein